MSISFRWLWFMWGVMVLYHAAAGLTGWPVERPAQIRIRECIDIAYFLGSSWFAMWMAGLVLPSSKGKD